MSYFGCGDPGYGDQRGDHMDIGELERIWESEPLEEPELNPEEPQPDPPQREQEPVPEP